MGGLAVFLSREGPPDPSTVRSMLGAAPHRGDRWTVRCTGQVALGVSNHPEWTTASLARRGPWVVGFHGNLDNQADLNAELRRGGVSEPADPTPAETVAAGYDRWGSDFVSRLRGSFAAVVTGGREALCFRDHFGTRPFFHHDAREGFYAATEAKQVLAGASISSEPDMDHLHRVLFGGLGRSTAFRGVERIPERMIARAGSELGLSFSTYWDPEARVETGYLDGDAALEGTVDALRRSVQRMLTGDDVILLSGGLDSPSIAAFAARTNGRRHPVQALTAIYPEHESVDESEWTRLAADHVGMPLDHYVASAGSLDDVDHWMRLVDGPVSALSIPESVEAYTEARSRGARTILTGEIAEMLFASRAHLLDHLLWHGRVGAAGRLLTERWRSGRSRRRMIREVSLAVAPPWMLPRGLRPPDVPRLAGLPPWVSPEAVASYTTEPPLWRVHPRDRWTTVQTSAFAGPSIGFEADEICATACGVDVRRPFTDVDLWEFVLGLSAEVKFPERRSKPLLRAAMRGTLPDELIDRKSKTYFDEFHLATADYPTLQRILVGSPHRLDGIDYASLQGRLEEESLEMYELLWARNLARVHAFLNQW